MVTPRRKGGKDSKFGDCESSVGGIDLSDGGDDWSAGRKASGESKPKSLSLITEGCDIISVTSCSEVGGDELGSHNVSGKSAASSISVRVTGAGRSLEGIGDFAITGPTTAANDRSGSASDGKGSDADEAESFPKSANRVPATGVLGDGVGAFGFTLRFIGGGFNGGSTGSAGIGRGTLAGGAGVLVVLATLAGG